jgi:exonuclease SbcC
MRLHALTVAGIAPHYRTPQTLDLAKLQGPIVAISGANGSGKSTLMGALRAALYRKFASGARAVDLALAADSYVRADVETGRGRFVVTQSMNGVARKARGEASVRDATGRDLLHRAQVSEYDTWCERNLPPWELVAASTFAAQADQGLLAADLAPQQRREILFRALGLDAIEPLPQRCRDRATTARQRGEVLDGQIAVERPRADVTAAEVAVCAAMTEEGAKLDALRSAEQALSTARETHAALVAAYEDAVAARSRAAVAVAAEQAARDAVRAVSDRQEECRRILAAAEQVERAAAALPDLAAVLATADQRVTEDRARLAAAERALSVAQDAHRDAVRRAEQAREAERRAVAAATDLPAARVAASEAEQLRGQTERAAVAVRERESAVEEIAALTLDVAGRRIGRLRTVLEELAETPADTPIEDVCGAAAEGLATDDETARGAAEAPTRLTAARSAVAAARREADTLRAALARAEGLAARLPDLERAAEASGRAVADAIEAGRRVADAERAVGAARADVETHRTTLSRTNSDAIAARGTHLAAAETARRAPEIAAARARAEELAAARSRAEQDLAEASDAVRLAPEPPMLPPQPADLSMLETAVRLATEAHRRADGAVAVARKALADAQAAAGRVRAIEAQRQEVDAEIADWRMLERTFVALLQLSIDAAGPELAAITTDLLRGGFGDRYTISVETKRVGDKGQEIEDCFVQVLDTVNGYAGPASGLSGGQLVIVGTAVRCAVASIGARTAGIVRPTLILDEAGAALEEPLIPAWIAMLRHAARVAGAEHVLVVSHSPHVWALADSVVRIVDGRIEVAA